MKSKTLDDIKNIVIETLDSIQSYQDRISAEENIKNIVIETLDSIQSYQDRISVEEIPANYKVECSELDHSAGVIRRRYVEYCA